MAYLPLFLAAVWLVARVASIQTSDNLLLHADQFLHGRTSEIIWVAVCLAAWVAVYAYNQGKPTRLSFLAVFAVLTTALNPILVEHALTRAGFRLLDDSDVAMRSFRANVVALLAGGLTVLRIDRSRGTLCGARIAVAAFWLNVLGILLWIMVAVADFCQEFQKSAKSWH